MRYRCWYNFGLYILDGVEMRLCFGNILVIRFVAKSVTDGSIFFRSRSMFVEAIVCVVTKIQQILINVACKNNVVNTIITNVKL